MTTLPVSIMRFLLYLFVLLCFLSSCHVDRRTEALALLREGEEMADSGNPNSAVNLFRKAADLSTATGDAALQSEIYNCLGDIFLQHGVYDRAIEAYQQAADYVQMLPDKSLLSRAYRGIGKYHYLCGNMKDALQYFQKARNLEDQIADVEEVSSIYNNLSNAYCELEDNDKALFCNSKAISLTKDSLKYFRNCAVRGRLLMLSHQYDSALYYIAIASRSNDARVRASSYYKLSEMPVASGITDSMKYVYLSLAKQLSDSIEDVNRSVQVVESEHLHQLQSLKSNAQSKLIYISFIVAAIVLLLVVYFHYWYKSKKNKYQQIIEHLDTSNRELHKVHEMNKSGWEKQLISITVSAGNSCVERFVAMPFYERLKKKLQSEDASLTYNEQDELRQVVFEVFGNYIQQLSVIIDKLSTNDSLLCCLSLLKFSTRECALCRGVSNETIRSQRTRIKKKIPENFLKGGLFNLIFGEESGGNG